MKKKGYCSKKGVAWLKFVTGEKGGRCVQKGVAVDKRGWLWTKGGRCGQKGLLGNKRVRWKIKAVAGE